MSTSTLQAKVKRSYNLRPGTVELGKRWANHAAATQHAFVERAIRKLARELQEEIDAQRWARAAQDPEFIAECDQIDREFPLTAEAWGE